MSQTAQFDPTDLLDVFRYAQLSHLLVAAVVEFDVGSALASRPVEYEELRGRLNLQPRAATVLLTGLRSLGLIDIEADGRVALTPYGNEKLDPASGFHLRGYIGLGGLSADVQHMIACLRNDRPAGDVSFVYHDGERSALDDAATSDVLTRAMADRARNVAPAVAERLDLAGCSTLVDVGGAHGLYSLELLKRYPALYATVVDRKPPLEVAAEEVERAGLSDRVSLQFGDAHAFELNEPVDAVLIANLLHDYDVDTAARLVRHYAGQLKPDGRLIVLDSLLESVAVGQPPVSSGPRPVAAYSALLFSICEGRCYRLDEVERWMDDAGLHVDPEPMAVPAHGTLLIGRKK